MGNVGSDVKVKVVKKILEHGYIVGISKNCDLKPALYGALKREIQSNLGYNIQCGNQRYL